MVTLYSPTIMMSDVALPYMSRMMLITNPHMAKVMIVTTCPRSPDNMTKVMLVLKCH